MKTINKIKERLEECNISVNEYEENDKLCGYELNTYTDASVNQILFLDFRDSKMNPKNSKHFIEMFNERVNDIDINEELIIHLEDVRYRNEIGAAIGIKDFADWKENLGNIFIVKSIKKPRQRQFEQVKQKFESLLSQMEELLELMPVKGDTENECQRTCLMFVMKHLEHNINGIEEEDFIPNRFSPNFKLSYS